MKAMKVSSQVITFWGPDDPYIKVHGSIFVLFWGNKAYDGRARET